MFKRNSFIIILTAGFILLSAVIYIIHYIIFHDLHHIFIYMVGDFAFLPLEVLIVVVLIERILARRETQAKLQKLNMVVGAFFSEIGNSLLQSMLNSIKNKEALFSHLNVKGNWTGKDFKKAANFISKFQMNIDINSIDLNELKKLLSEKREFLLTLLENPNLLEHDRFTDVLWAVMHLDEELEARTTFKNLPISDLEHIAGDIRRMYSNMLGEWLDYVEHLKLKYPYLFSLVTRTHPFQPNPSAVIK